MRCFNLTRSRTPAKIFTFIAASLALLCFLRGVVLSLSAVEAAQYSALKREYSGLAGAASGAGLGQWRALIGKIAVFRKELKDKDAFDDVDYLAGLCQYQAAQAGGVAHGKSAETIFMAIAAEGPGGGELAANAAFMLGRVYEQAGRYEKAFTAYSGIPAEHPNEPIAAKALRRAEHCLTLAPALRAKLKDIPTDFSPRTFGTAVDNSTRERAAAELSDVKIWSARGSTRFAIEFKGEPEYSYEESGQRITLTFRDTRATALIRSMKVDDGLVKSINLAEAGGGTRLTLLLDKPEDYRVFPLYEPFRMIIDVDGVKKERPAYIGAVPRNIKTPEARSSAEAARRAARPMPSLYRIRTIVLDPGHGGRDPGGVGPGGLKEKDLNLAVALKLKEMLRCNPAYEVFLTRESDVFVPLEQRAVAANRKEADIFISIHANAAPRSLTDSGFETYYLGEASDSAAGLAAEYENGRNVRNLREMLPLLRRLKKAVKGKGSLGLAAFIQQELVAGSGLPDRGVKTAPFAVLVGTRMPAVLTEMGFLSNPKEEKLLRENAVRQKLAKSLYSAVERYSGRKD